MLLDVSHCVRYANATCTMYPRPVIAYNVIIQAVLFVFVCVVMNAQEMSDKLATTPCVSCTAKVLLRITSVFGCNAANLRLTSCLVHLVHLRTI